VALQADRWGSAVSRLVLLVLLKVPIAEALENGRGLRAVAGRRAGEDRAEQTCGALFSRRDPWVWHVLCIPLPFTLARLPSGVEIVEVTPLQWGCSCRRRPRPGNGSGGAGPSAATGGVVQAISRIGVVVRVEDRAIRLIIVIVIKDFGVSTGGGPWPSTCRRGKARPAAGATCSAASSSWSRAPTGGGWSSSTFVSSGWLVDEVVVELLCPRASASAAGRGGGGARPSPRGRRAGAPTC